MAKTDQEIIDESRARSKEWREKRIRDIQVDGGFSLTQAQWLVDRDLDLPHRTPFSPNDTPIGPGSGYEP